jgi:perosamine synthetase
MIDMFTTSVSDDAVNIVNETLKSTFISSGKKADKFEDRLKIFDLIRPVTVNSGTSALHLALASAGISEGDEVILPSQTFIATGLTILHQKATPVFADINYMSGNISPESIREKITDKTKAIMVVHWAGYPCDMDEIQLIADEHNLIVIEDAAHAFGSWYKDRPIGSISDYTCFSFQAIKMLTTGDGGAVCSLTDENEKHLKKLRWFNIDRDDDKSDELGERVYNSNEIGYKYHMNDVSASIGIGNLYTVGGKLKRYKEITGKYRETLHNIEGITLFENKSDRISSNWLFGMHVDCRDDFIKKMKDNGITTSVVHLGIDKNDLFGGKDESLINQRKFDNSQIHIPIHDDLSNKDVDKIINTIKSGW